jgi:hypothetical protein
MGLGSARRADSTVRVTGRRFFGEVDDFYEGRERVIFKSYN